MFEIVDGRTDDDGRTPEHGYTISSPCEPNGSGELKNEPCHKKTNVLVSDLVQQKPGCTATEDG